MPKKRKHTLPPEPKNVGKRSHGASHKHHKINLWDEAEKVCCLEEYNQQLVKLESRPCRLFKYNFLKQNVSKWKM